MSHLDSLEGLGERTYLVHLNENTVGSAHLDTLFKELHVGNEEVVTYQLAAVANLGGQLHPVFPVVLVESILNRIDRILGNQFLEICDLLLCGELLAIRILGHSILQLAIVVEPLAIFLNGKLRSRAVHSNLHRSEEHTSELQSRQYLVCRLLLEKKKEKVLTLATAI